MRPVMGWLVTVSWTPWLATAETARGPGHCGVPTLMPWPEHASTGPLLELGMEVPGASDDGEDVEDESMADVPELGPLDVTPWDELRGDEADVDRLCPDAGGTLDDGAADDDGADDDGADDEDVAAPLDPPPLPSSVHAVTTTQANPTKYEQRMRTPARQ